MGTGRALIVAVVFEFSSSCLFTASVIFARSLDASVTVWTAATSPTATASSAVSPMSPMVCSRPRARSTA